MSAVIHQETVVFLLSVLHGAALAFAYDVLRALRRAFRHAPFAVAAEDFLFWLMAGFLTFCLAFFRTDGVIRGYVAAGMALGAVLYRALLGAAVLWCLSGALCFLKRMFLLIWRFLSDSVKKICRLPKKRIEFARKRGYNGNKNKVRGNRHGKKKETAEPQ